MGRNIEKYNKKDPLLVLISPNMALASTWAFCSFLMIVGIKVPRTKRTGDLVQQKECHVLHMIKRGMLHEL